MARLLSIALAAAFGLSLGCSASTLGTDLGIVQPGCRIPSACYVVDCPCNRGDVYGPDGGQGGPCKACNPDVQFCICPLDQMCIEPPTVCVGKSQQLCGGVGARCLPAGASCATGGTGTAPQLIANSANGALLEPHCQYVDDVCCAGVSSDLGVTD
jgi:hypothetical protein